jgi:hypothetical protein
MGADIRPPNGGAGKCNRPSALCHSLSGQQWRGCKRTAICEEGPTMRLNQGMIRLMLSATALASASAMTGCAGGALVYGS